MKTLTRRDFVRLTAGATGGAIVAGCAGALAPPQVPAVEAPAEPAQPAEAEQPAAEAPVSGFQGELEFWDCRRWEY
jgi:hypothetical protein